MIRNGEGCHYLVVKKLSAILRAVTPKHQDDFRCLNSFHSFATENKRDVMPSEDNKILEFNHY